MLVSTVMVLLWNPELCALRGSLRPYMLTCYLRWALEDLAPVIHSITVIYTAVFDF